jgi:hypothetical protein
LQDHVHGRAEGQRRSDNFIAGSDAERGQRQVQPGGSGVERQGALRFGVSRELGLKSGHPRTAGEPAGAKRADDFLNLLFADIGQGERKVALFGKSVVCHGEYLIAAVIA